MKKRVKECIVCGSDRCMEFEDKFYCFRFGVTRKKSSQTGKKNNGGFEEEGLGGGTFSKVPPSKKANKNQGTFDFGENVHCFWENE